MKNKGFTLVELLAVVIILLLVITIITPKVLKQLNTSENITRNEQINSLINIAKIYTNQNTEKLPEKNSVSIISIDELEKSNLINKSEVINPKTNQELTGCILIKDEGNKYKYEYNEDKCNNLITVTFDPQGGQLDQTSKNVISNDTYGILPTPTREGYTFKGWNGKNLFDMEAWLNLCNSAYGGTFVKTNSSITLTATTSDAYTKTYFVTRVRYGNINALKTPIKPSENYTLSWKKNLDDEGSLFIFINDKDSKDGPTYQFSSNKLTSKITLTTPSDAEYLRIRVDVANGNSVTFSNIQLEEGDTATPYEPYYITSDTTVVQESNHTLKAIWEANS